MKKFFSPIFAAIALLAFSCSKNPTDSSSDPSGDSQKETQDVKVEIRVEEAGGEFASEISYSIRVRQTSYLEVKLTPEDSPAKITYETGDISIARVSRNGTITGRGEGSTDIKVLSDGAVKAVCHLTVTEYEAEVSEFSLDVSNVELEWGSSQRVVVKRTTPIGLSVGDISFEFSSSDEDIFTVENDSDGFGCKITGIKPGEGTLHAEVKSAALDIPVVITRKTVGLESWRYDSPYNDMEPMAFWRESLTAFYPTFTDVYVWDDVSKTRLNDSLNGKYSAEVSDSKTLTAAPFEDCVSIVAKGDGSSDSEGWGYVSLHYENDLVVSDVDLEVEFRGFNGMHGDMTIVDNNPNSDNYGKDLCGATQTISSSGTIKVRLGRKSGDDLMGVYRPNADKEWVKLVTDGLDVVRWDNKTLSLNAKVSEGASSCMVLFQGQYGSVKNLVVNYKVK